MTAKEKAIELITKYQYAVRFDESETGYFTNMHSVKECALIAVNEMLDFRNGLYINEGSLAHQYLLDVKREIESYEV